MESVKTRVFAHEQLGLICIEGSHEVGITGLSYVADGQVPAQSDDPLLVEVEAILQRYFKGEAVDFSNIPVALAGTPFQKSVWQALRTIPWGETRSYKWLAQQVGVTTGARAVGNANGKNPIPILIPCHRVIHSNGGLGGYTGGLGIKRILLDIEQVQPRLQTVIQFENLMESQPKALTL